MSSDFSFDLAKLREAVTFFLEISERMEAGPPADEVGFTDLVESISPILRAWLDMMARLLQQQALETQLQFRAKRAGYQKEHRRGRSWIHDVRVKNTPNGLSVEWLYYKGKYGSTVFSEGIRTDGKSRVPAKNFRSCSAIEREAISAAEDQFSASRRATQRLSILAGALTAISQMRLVNSHPYVSPFDDPLDCRFGCWCSEPCEEYLNSSNYRLERYQ